MVLENLEKELKDGILQSLYLLYGEETFLLETCVKKIKALFGECIKGINYIIIDDTNLQNLISDIETPAFGYEKKLIIAKNTQIFKKEGKKKNVELTKQKEKILDYFKDNLKVIKDTCVIVFIEEEAQKQELFDIFDKNGVVCNFEFQKPIQIEKRIMAICNAYEVKIEKSTLMYLIESVGTSMQELINEIRKLIEYVGKGGIIKKEAVDKLSIKKIESIIFDLTDNLGKKNLSEALKVLENLIYAKEPMQKILITLYNHFRKIYITKLAINNNRDVTACLNLKPNQSFLTGKYKMQANYFDENNLKEMLKNLIDLDYESKNGLIDLRIGFESILCMYCS